MTNAIKDKAPIENATDDLFIDEKYSFVDGDIDCIAKKTGLFINADYESSLWVQIHKKDVEYMMRVFGIESP
tara:strand:+ start:1282 stop:1497 length:216 start_codon:yes stop_codon:yes gene_type:complete